MFYGKINTEHFRGKGRIEACNGKAMRCVFYKDMVRQNVDVKGYSHDKVGVLKNMYGDEMRGEFKKWNLNGRGSMIINGQKIEGYFMNNTLY